MIHHENPNGCYVHIWLRNACSSNHFPWKVCVNVCRCAFWASTFKTLAFRCCYCMYGRPPAAYSGMAFVFWPPFQRVLVTSFACTECVFNTLIKPWWYVKILVPSLRKICKYFAQSIHARCLCFITKSR